MARKIAPSLTVEIIATPRRRAWKLGETLPPQSRQTLLDLDLWADFEANGHTPQPGFMSVWGSPDIRHFDFITSPYGPGWQLDPDRFESALYTALARHEIPQRTTAVQNVEPSAHGHRLTLEGNQASTETLDATFVIDATGRSSWLARRLGVSRQMTDRLTGLFTVVPAESSTGKIACSLVEAVPDGWWYTSRLPEGSTVVGLLTDSDQIANNALRDWRSWAKQLSKTAAVRDAVNWPLVDQQEISVVPSGTSRLATIGGPGWLAAGDAAMTFDPLSSQGILMAMISGSEAGAAAVSVISGDAAGGGQYCQRQTARLKAYLAQRAQYYAAEQRWRDHIFWRRRHTGADALL